MIEAPLHRNTWLEIDLVQFRRNLAAMRDVAPTRMLLVVKANAYGHGLVRMALEAQAAGVDMLGVATIGEAAALLNAGIAIPILCICPLDGVEIDWAVLHGVHFMAWRPDQFAVAYVAANKYDRQPLIHIEVDIGMARSGVAPGDFVTFIDSIDAHQLSKVTGLCAHFPFGASALDTDPLEEELGWLLDCQKELHARNVYPLTHLANTSGTLRYPPAHLDMIRMGFSAYGNVASKYAALPDAVAPILSWKATVTNTRSLAAGSGVMYDWEYVANVDHDVATIGVGYADGFHRHPANVNTVLINGVETPVLGRVTMDQSVFRVPDGMTVNVGDEVVLLGQQGDAKITTTDLAARWETNRYECLIGIRDRVPRVYLG